MLAQKRPRRARVVAGAVRASRRADRVVACVSPRVRDRRIATGATDAREVGFDLAATAGLALSALAHALGAALPLVTTFEVTFAASFPRVRCGEGSAAVTLTLDAGTLGRVCLATGLSAPSPANVLEFVRRPCGG